MTLITTVSICAVIAGLTIPVPRRAEAIATNANCSESPGRYQRR